MAMTTFVERSAKKNWRRPVRADYVGQLDVEPGRRSLRARPQKVTLKMKNEVFLEERLIPLHDPQQLIAGLVRVDDAAGRRGIRNAEIGVGADGVSVRNICPERAAAEKASHESSST